MNRKTYTGILALVAACLTLSFLTGCGSSNSKSITTPPPPTIAITAGSGAGQVATVGQPFAKPLVANVTSNGSPLSGATVTFSAPGSGASCALSGATATTDANGNAQITCTANTTSGAYNITASTTKTTTTASFGLTNNAGAAATISTQAGATQSTTVATAFSTNLAVKVMDSYSNPVGGVTVTFAAPSSGPSGAFAGGANTATTDSTGLAIAGVFTANTKAGSYTVAATVSGVSTPANFSLTNNAGSAAIITATSGTPQNTATARPFGNALVANVTDSYSNPLSGVSVNFAVPGSGASCTPSATGGSTDANGNVSITCIANTTVGGPYNVTASATGVETPANFSLTNDAVYALYVSGEEAPNTGNSQTSSYYALAGVVVIGPNGAVVGGLQDYNDGSGITQISLSITGGTLTASNAAGQSILTLITNNGTKTQLVGVAGTETLAVQFVNANHALITQFDGSATSSGSMDLQTLTAPAANFAFTLAGSDYKHEPVGYGGVFAVGNEGALTGTADVNDAGTVTQGVALTGTITAADANYGRGTATVSINNTTLSLAFYVVGAEAIRIIDVDPGGVNQVGSAACGSAYGQGSGTFDSTSLGASVFGIGQGDPMGYHYAAVGSFATTSSAGVATGTYGTDSTPSQSGIGDEIDSIGYSPGSIGGKYTVASNGYGSLTDYFGLGVVNTLGLYMTDPTLNLLDPNNKASGTGGALLLDLDTHTANLSGGVGVVIPQTDTSPSSFENSTYAAGARGLATTGQLDFVGQFPFSSLALNQATADLNDLFGYFTGGTPMEYTGATLTGTAAADANESTNGRYTLPLVITPSAATGPTNTNVVVYQANGGQLFWVEANCCTMFLGTLEQQSTSLPSELQAKGVPVAKLRAKRNLR